MPQLSPSMAFLMFATILLMTLVLLVKISYSNPSLKSSLSLSKTFKKYYL
uniref:ATP synthase F0 subunit 8 n=1 Tax=Sagaminopteron nigropunctatum TaxID=1874340 RepID=E6Y1D6_9GAST|nr:ATP synthase F0 subunit 8 [Sagaminopteron nigropunctatum]